MNERKKTATGAATAPASVQSSETDAPVTAAAAPDTEYLKAALGEPQQTTGEEETYVQELLAELDFLNLKEKKDQTAAVQQQSQKIMQQLQTPPKAAVPENSVLLGILGPCQLKGHIVHFFNLSFKIEKHIRTLEELTDPRFVKAYHYLKSHPSVEAVFVYNNKMRAHCRIGSRVVVRSLSE